ncbi:hypothetical protein [Bacillus mojavensis]
MHHFSEEEMIKFNDMMLKRIESNRCISGYNNTDRSVCKIFFHGLSYAQLANLAKRLVKYSETQLNVSKESMMETEKYYLEKANIKDWTKGISLNGGDYLTSVSFRYNEQFIEQIKRRPRGQWFWDNNSKQWLIPNENLIITLKSLEKVGADVKNAIEYAKNHILIQKLIT